MGKLENSGILGERRYLRFAELNLGLYVMQESLREHQIRTRDLQADYDSLREKLAATETEVEAAAKREAELSGELEALQTSRDLGAKEHELRIQSLEGEVDKRIKLLEDLENDLQASRAHEAERTTELRALQAREKELQEEIEIASTAGSAESEHLQEFAFALIGRVQQLELDAFDTDTDFEHRLAQSTEDYEMARAFETLLRDELLKQEAKYESSRRDGIDLEEALFSAESALETRQADLEATHRELASLEEALADSRQQVESLSADLEGRENSTSDHLADLDSAVTAKQLAEEQRDAAIAETVHMELEIEKLRVEVDGLKESLEDAQREQQDAAAVAGQSAGDTSAVDENQLELANEEARIARERADRLSGELERRRLEARVLSGELESAREAVDQAQRKREEAEALLAEAAQQPQEEIDTLRSENESLTAKVQKAETRASLADDRTVQLEQKLSLAVAEADATSRRPSTDRSASRSGSSNTKTTIGALLGGAILGAGLLFGVGSTPWGTALFGSTSGKQPSSVTAPKGEAKPTTPPAAVATPSVTEAAAPGLSNPIETAAPGAILPSIDLEPTIEAWAEAWSGGDANTYLGFYSRSFIPPHGLSRKAWEAQRRDRLGAPKSIEIELGSMTPNPIAEDRIVVTFVQTYRTQGYQDTVQKTLDFTLEDGRWLIVEELSQSIQ